MISNVKEKAVSNTFIQSLQESMVARELETADCLILSHRDEILTNRLGLVMQSVDSLLLEQPQTEWRFGQSHLAATVAWAVEHAEVHSLYICGHSLVASQEPPVHVAGRFSANAEDNSVPNSIIDRLFENQNQLQDAKTLFASQVDQVLAIPAVEEAIQNEQLKVHALFFLAQSGAFMAYDPNTREYQPLVTNDARI